MQNFVVIKLSVGGITKEILLDKDILEIYPIELLNLNRNRSKFYVRTTKGTYLQTLILPGRGTVGYKNGNNLDLRRDNLFIIHHPGESICEREGCNKPNQTMNLCTNHYKQTRPQDSKKYYSTPKGKAKRRVADDKFKSKHESGYGTLRRMAQKTNKLLEIGVEKYKELKASGCSVCHKQLTGRSSGIYLVNKRKNYTLDNIKVLCRSCRARRNTEEFNFINHCMKRIRGNWNHTPNAILAKELARQENGQYKCSKCLDCFSDKLVQVDHIEPVISVVDGFVSLDEYAKRMFCSVNNLTVLCKPCHKIKTKNEQEQRKLHGAIHKTKEKLKSGLVK